MALPARLTAALGRHPDDLTEADLQRAVDNRIPEGVDLDWKKDFHPGSDAGRKELAKDVAAMANTVGGLLVIGVDDVKQDHAHALAPFEPALGRGEEWIRSVIANWIQPVVPNVGVRSLKAADEGKIYWLITVPPSTQMPHAVAAPGNDYNFRVHVRHGTTTRTLAESEIAQRYRDRFHAAAVDVDRVQDVSTAGLAYLSRHVMTEVPAGGNRAAWYPIWVSVTAVPAVRGDCPLTTQEERNAALDRCAKLAYQAVTSNMKPNQPALVGRRQVRFEGIPTGQLHQDGSSYGALPLNVKADPIDNGAPSGCTSADSSWSSWPRSRWRRPGRPRRARQATSCSPRHSTASTATSHPYAWSCQRAPSSTAPPYPSPRHPPRPRRIWQHSSRTNMRPSARPTLSSPTSWPTWEPTSPTY
ncbi:helix-turn-helix domain-containing protein [Streptomyces sp. NPDC051704]|uniref:helix-turn-helix domain-containing protein n=1 Tax=Streptomyces sp. NPDC051704 TaxID=3365671 RepID=UPI0037AAE845